MGTILYNRLLRRIAWIGVACFFLLTIGCIFPPDYPDPDNYEPDNSFATAQPIEVDESQYHSFHEGDNCDFAVAQLSQGVVYKISTGDYRTATLGFYNAMQQRLDRTDDQFVSSSYYFQCEADGVYYIQVKRTKDCFDTYNLLIHAYAFPTQDIYEPDDTINNASTINVLGTPYTHTFHKWADEDYMKIDLTEGVGYFIKTDKATTWLDLDLVLYNIQGQVLIQKDTTITYPAYHFFCESTGTYFIHIKEAHNVPGDYTLTVSTDPLPAKDSYEPDDTSSQAKLVTVGAPAQTHTLHKYGDVDYLKLELQAGTGYKIMASQATAAININIYLLDANMQAIKSVGGTSSENPFFYFACPATDTYYLKIDSWLNTPGDYTIRLETIFMPNPDAYESIDTDVYYKLTNTIYIDGTAQDHTIHDKLDNDYIRVFLTKGTQIKIETYFGTYPLDLKIALLREGSQITTANSNLVTGTNAKIIWTCSESRFYTIRIAPTNAPDLGDYTLDVKTISY